MKTVIGKVGFFAALTIALLPLIARAQNSSGQVGGVSRGGKQDLTLLPGPTLLSPARGAPQAGESIVIRPVPGTLTFLPAPPPRPASGTLFLGGPGTLTLGSSDPAKVQPRRHELLPRPDLFRFDAKLQVAPMKLQPTSGALNFDSSRL